MPYVDGFLIPVPKKNVKAYMQMSRKAGKIWKKYGALEYRECVGDDLTTDFGSSFPKLMKLKPGETVIFSWIVYKSKAHRDKVNKQVMADPDLAKTAPKVMPFDIKRMCFGGFKIGVDL